LEAAGTEELDRIRWRENAHDFSESREWVIAKRRNFGGILEAAGELPAAGESLSASPQIASHVTSTTCDPNDLKHFRREMVEAAGVETKIGGFSNLLMARDF
jgi:hypothetical protein